MNNNYEKFNHSLIPDYLFQKKRITLNNNHHENIFKIRLLYPIDYSHSLYHRCCDALQRLEVYRILLCGWRSTIDKLSDQVVLKNKTII